MLFPLQPHEGAHEPAVLRVDLFSLPVFSVAQAHSYPQRTGSALSLQLAVTGLSANCIPWTLFTRCL